jgi:signal transduction histidine kinase
MTGRLVDKDPQKPPRTARRRRFGQRTGSPHNLIGSLRRTVAALHEKNEALSLALSQIRAAQERLLESERMAAVGRVASGIAHEIGNQLSVLSYAELISDRYPDDGEIRLFSAAILSARTRLAGLVREIRDFSRVHGQSHAAPIPAVEVAQFSLRPEPVAQAVQEALSILRFDPAFRLRSVDREHAVDNQAVALVNRDKLVQVVLNLLRNAVDATPQNGAIEIRLEADPPTVAHPLVRLTIEDAGAGIPPEVLPHIFEPFFSTKGERGTGLGLGICRNIITQHGGELRVDSPLPVDSPSEQKGGTRVTVLLPRALTPAPPGADPASGGSPSRRP